ncbi:Uncharacterized protein HZ326_8065 [Fusarium oxysporum f. sp. albedinis]|nr:Uncharacterized protein HZ326_8065 [Fusarium oxysporum f. sp. albedinis]
MPLQRHLTVLRTTRASPLAISWPLTSSAERKLASSRAIMNRNLLHRHMQFEEETACIMPPSIGKQMSCRKQACS